MPLTAVQTALLVGGGVVGFAAAAWPVAIWLQVGACEKPKYTVIKPLSDEKRFLTGNNVAELREYAPYMISEVTVKDVDTMKQAMSSGFRQNAGFIFGKNTSRKQSGSESVSMTSPVRLEMPNAGGSESIAMTSPVRSELSGGTYKISFTMPSKYTMDTLPKPDNPNVRIIDVPSHKVAAVKFSGHVKDEAHVKKYEDKLLTLMEKAGLKPKGDLKLYQYHPPFSPGWLRLNEVLYEVEE